VLLNSNILVFAAGESSLSFNDPVNKLIEIFHKQKIVPFLLGGVPEDAFLLLEPDSLAGLVVIVPDGICRSCEL
jgi:hypothetical protein